MFEGPGSELDRQASYQTIASACEEPLREGGDDVISSSRPMMASMASQLSSGSYPGSHWSCSQALRTKEARTSNTKGVHSSAEMPTSRANGMATSEESRPSATAAAP